MSWWSNPSGGSAQGGSSQGWSGQAWWQDASWQQWWQCQLCHIWHSQGQKKCHKCGLKKSFGQSAGGANAAWWSSPPAHVAASEPTTTTPIQAKAPLSSTPPQPAPAQGSDDPREQIKAVEAALSVLPDVPSLAAARAPLLLQQEALKRAITQQRPLGSQLDSCRAAVERAEKRRGECQAAHAKAGQALDQANLDLAKKQSELQTLERAVAAATRPRSSLEELTEAVSKVWMELQASTVVPASVTTDAGSAM